MPTIPVNTYVTLPHTITHITSIEPVVLARISAARSSLTRHFQVTWSRLCLFAYGWGWRYGTTLFGYRSGCSNGTHHYNHDLVSWESNRGTGDGCPIYFVNSWALGWSLRPATPKVEWSAVFDICYFTLLLHCYLLSHWLLLHIVIFSIFAMLLPHYYTLFKYIHTIFLSIFKNSLLSIT